MELVVLGAGGFLPQPDRPLPGFAVRHDGKVYLLDAGEGTQVRMVEHGVSSAKLDAICISHLHGDHVFGLPGVMVRRSQEGQRTDPLDLFAPGPISSFLDGLVKAGSLQLPYEWNLRTLSHEKRFELNDLSLTVASLNHRVETFGFALEVNSSLRRFRPGRADDLDIPEGPIRSKLQKGETVRLEDGREIEPEQVTDPPESGPKLVYITDTRPCYDLPGAFHSPELLIHEGMFLSDDKQHAQEKKHSTATEAARVAGHIEADRLLLTHFSHRYDNETVLLDEARETFQKTSLAQPGLTVEL
jgi:ribonuclease Z